MNATAVLAGRANRPSDTREITRPIAGALRAGCAVLAAVAILAVAVAFAAHNADPIPASAWRETDAMPFFLIPSAYGLVAAAFSAVTP